MKHSLLGIFLCLSVALIWITAPGQTATTVTAAPASTAEATRVREADGMVMVHVPAGEFLLGSPAGQGYDDEHPQHPVTLDAFWIDRTEVANAQYAQCTAAGACAKPEFWDRSLYSAFNGADQPVVGVAWNDATDYCTWAGARLPTEAEWEKAARGSDGRAYPWGNEDPTCERAKYGDCGGKTAPVGSYPAGASPYGALDMAGNVGEWVADWYAADYYAHSPQQNPTGPDTGKSRGLRGGGYYYLGDDVRSALRGRADPVTRGDDGGFRCVMAASSPEPPPSSGIDLVATATSSPVPPTPSRIDLVATATSMPAPSGAVEEFFKVWSTGVAYNGATAPTTFTIDKAWQVTEILSYHWNEGHGMPSPGTIGLKAADGLMYGPWPAAGQDGQGGVPNAAWVVHPNIVIPPGDYTVIDSDPATWSQNQETGGAGMAWGLGSVPSRRPWWWPR